MKLKDVCEILFSNSIKNKIPAIKKEYWLTQADLQENNVISLNQSFNDFDLSTCLKPIKGDVLIKRNNPTYVNVYESEKDCYLCSNIIILRASKIDAYYLAFYIEQNLNKLNALTNQATISKAISRQMLEEFEINKIDKDKEMLIGKVWALNKKRNYLMENLLLKGKLQQKVIEQKLLNNWRKNLND